MYISCFIGKATPQEIEHHFSIRFPRMQCKSIQSREELRSAIEKEVSDTLSTIPGCHTCQLKTLTVPKCTLASNQKSRRALDHSVEVHFSLVVKEAVNLSSSEDSVEEKSEAVLFQMQYAVAAGQFIISLHGQNISADRSSFEHISSNITCGAGFVSTSSRKECGKHCSSSTIFLYNLYICRV